MFTSEKEMSLHFERYLRSKIGNAYLKEQKGLFGIPDFIIFEKGSREDYNLVSFELKIRNWKRAMIQAFRHKSFSNVSYVVTSNENADLFARNLSKFKKYQIGLASIDDQRNLRIYYKPKSSKPYSVKLRQEIEGLLSKKKKSTQEICIHFRTLT